ncbi:MAG: NAD-glutamate dehydrogenase domain-containing protein [Lentisphaeria bacterium]
MLEQKSYLDSAVAESAKVLAASYATLNQVMPVHFFEVIDSKIAIEVVSLFHHLSPDGTACTREVSGKTVRFYLKSGVSAKSDISANFVAGEIYESVKTVTVAGAEYTVVVEIYALTVAEAAPMFALSDLKAIAKSEDPDFDELYNRIHWGALHGDDKNCVVATMKAALELQGASKIQCAIKPSGSKNCLKVIAPNAINTCHFFGRIADVFVVLGCKLECAKWQNFSKCVDAEDLTKQAVDCGVFYFDGPAAKFDAIIRAVKTLYWSDDDDVYYSELVVKRGFAIENVNILRAVGEFAHSQFVYINPDKYSKAEIARLICVNFMAAEKVVSYFYAKFSPQGSSMNKDTAREALVDAIAKINSGIDYKTATSQSLFKAILNFIDVTVKTNFFVADKAALSFRLLPSFMEFYGAISSAYMKAFPKGSPFGVFYFFRSKASGFQVRFTEIARGGWRTLIPRPGGNSLEKYDIYDSVNREYFREVFVLAHTQNQKNKDIYEGGSKMITLFDSFRSGSNFKPKMWEIQKAILDSLLVLINYDADDKLKNKDVVDLLGYKEIIEVGPDEFMLDNMIQYMGNYAAAAGYTLGGGIISGKPDNGMNHKKYGVTSFGLYQFFLRTLKELGIDGEKDEFTVKLSGGTNGDVAGNMLDLILAKKENGEYIHKNMKIIAITAGSGVLYDPAGIDRVALEKLVLKGNIPEFDKAALKGEGAFLTSNNPIIEEGEEYFSAALVENGKLVEKRIFRDDYMAINQNNMKRYADIMLPCGGRPQTVNMDNVEEYMNKNGHGCRAILEGGNSFITPEARIELQKSGILIIKDASANKCGVITSSYEVLSGLMLTIPEFKAIRPTLVAQVKERLAFLANAEADWLYAQKKATGKYMTDLSQKVSDTINAKNMAIYDYLGSHEELITDEMMLGYLPAIYIKQYRDRLGMIPAQYRRAIASVEMATRIIYKGLTSTKGLEGEVELAVKDITK